MLSFTNSGWIYDLSRDPEFFDQPENTGNLVEYASRYFHQMAGLERYRVRALLIGISMGVRTIKKGVLGSPKGAVMIVDSWEDEVLELRRLLRVKQPET